MVVRPVGVDADAVNVKEDNAAVCLSEGAKGR
jgi:hypothetical protein